VISLKALWQRPVFGYLIIFSLAASILILSGRAHFMQRVKGAPATSPSPSIPWTPPAACGVKPVRFEPAVSVERFREMSGRLTLADAVDVALKNNPVTMGNFLYGRLDWAFLLLAVFLAGGPDLEKSSGFKAQSSWFKVFGSKLLMVDGSY
jgi:hypothetical protein